MAGMDMWRSDNLTIREKEIQAVIHWFVNWSSMQREDFIKNLLDKALPANVDALDNALNSLELAGQPPSIFKCQLKLFNGWFIEWTQKDRDNFMGKLTEIDPAFVRRFYELLEAESTQTQ
ncbi:uncharacterized protein C14orf119-like [Ptychodera flava]|uniref:uncharacterized protein C14orf119-like n=1 Tax=Ptychodera flava TaxID=63121 RepID=UPI003969C5BD